MRYYNRIIFYCDKAINGVVYLILFADSHVGNENCDIGYIKAVFDFVAQTPNCYIIFNGDLIENTIMNSPASIFNDTIDPLSQIELFCEMAKEVVSQGKVICATVGNHELRSSKQVGMNPMDIIITKLSLYDKTLPERYYPAGATVFLNIKAKNKPNSRSSNSTFLLYAQHGKGSGTTLGSAINQSEKEKRSINGIANIYCRSHTHKAYCIPNKIIRADFQHYDIKEEQGWYVSNGAFLNYWGSYGQMAGYEPQDNGTPLITLKAIRQTHKEGNKVIDSVMKYCNAEIKSKEWFLEQVRKK